MRKRQIELIRKKLGPGLSRAEENELISISRARRTHKAKCKARGWKVT